MPLPARRLAAALLAVLAAQAAVARAQAPVARVPHAGRVLDVNEKPVAGAKVTLVSEGGRDGFDDGDVVHADADGEGRFRAQLQPMRAYVAWATTACEGGSAVSSVVDVGSLPIELVAGTAPAPAFRLTGVEPWRAHGELRVEIVMYDSAALTLRAAPDDMGRLALPPMPDVTVDVRVFVGERLVHAAQVSTTESARLPKPHRIAMRVADEKGQPIAKAVIERVVWNWAMSSGPFGRRPEAKSFPVATTRDDGTAEVLLAADADPFQGGRRSGKVLFRARHDGHAPGLSGFTKKAFVNGKLVEDEQPAVLPFVLAAPNAVPIKVLASRDQMPAAVQRVGWRQLPVTDDLTVAVVDGESSPVRDGVVRLEKSDEASQWFIELPSVSPPLPADDRWQRSVRAMPLVLPSSALQAGELDLRTVLPLCVQVLDLGGGPANGARLLCAAAADDSFLDPASAMQAHADRSGRVVLPVLPGNWFVMALTEHGIAHAVVKAAPGLAPQTLPLRALDRMRVRVVDGDGRPVHGAAFSLNGSSWSVDSTGEDAMLRTVGWHVSQWTLQRGASDARGNADLSFFAWKGLLMRLEVSKGDLETRVPRPEASDERIEVVLK